MTIPGILNAINTVDPMVSTLSKVSQKVNEAPTANNTNVATSATNSSESNAGGTSKVSSTSSTSTVQESVSISTAATNKVASESDVKPTQVVQDLDGLKATLKNDNTYQQILANVSRMDEVFKMLEGNGGVTSQLSNQLASSMGSTNIPGMTQTENLAYSIYASGTSKSDVERWLNTEVQRDPAMAQMLLTQKDKYQFQMSFMVEMRSTLNDTSKILTTAQETVFKKPDVGFNEVSSAVSSFVDRYNKFMSKASADIAKAGPDKSDGLSVNHAFFAMKRDTETFTYSSGAFNELSDIGVNVDEKTGTLSFDASKLESAFNSDKSSVLALLNDFTNAYTGTNKVYADEDSDPIQSRIDNIQKGLDWLDKYAPALKNMENAQNTQNTSVRMKMQMYVEVSYMSESS